MLQIHFELNDSVPPEGNLNFVPEWKHLDVSENELIEMIMFGEIKPEVEQRLSEEDAQWFKKWLPRCKANEAVCEHVPL